MRRVESFDDEFDFVAGKECQQADSGVDLYICAQPCGNVVAVALAPSAFLGIVNMGDHLTLRCTVSGYSDRLARLSHCWPAP